MSNNMKCDLCDKKSKYLMDTVFGNDSREFRSCEEHKHLVLSVRNNWVSLMSLQDRITWRD